MDRQRAAGPWQVARHGPHRAARRHVAALGSRPRGRVPPPAAAGFRLRSDEDGSGGTEGLRADAGEQSSRGLLGGFRWRPRLRALERDRAREAPRRRHDLRPAGVGARAGGAQRRLSGRHHRLLRCQIRLLVHPAVAARSRAEVGLPAAQSPELSRRPWLPVDRGRHGARGILPARRASICWRSPTRPQRRGSGPASTIASTSRPARTSVARSPRKCWCGHSADRGQ